MNIPNVQFSAGVTPLKFNLIGGDTGNEVAKNPTGTSFDSFLQAFMDIYKETDQSIKASENMQLDLATGLSDDIVGLSLAMEKANASLNFTVQITNRILEAYKEIMRIQL